MLDKLLTDVMTIDDLKALYVETFMNHTNKVSKVSDLSVVNAHAYGVAKLFQKDLKDTAILESQIFPELSSGSYLDKAAMRVGGLVRLGAAASSTFVLVYAEPGTSYIPGESSFTSTKGVTFGIVSFSTVGDSGYMYIPVRSQGVGENTNVEPLTINSMISPPVGHMRCTNEYYATGGRNEENDVDFKQRILSFFQFSTKSTLGNLLSNLQELEPNILKVQSKGVIDGKLNLSLLTCNGQWFTDDELREFEGRLSQFMCISDVNVQGTEPGVVLSNYTWFQVGGSGGVDFRVEFDSGVNENEVRKNIQVRMTKYFDFRYWDKKKVEWDDLLMLVKSVKGVKYVPDEYFLPKTDMPIPSGTLPRVIKFVMRDMIGNTLYNNSGSILPIYYP